MDICSRKWCKIGVYHLRDGVSIPFSLTFLNLKTFLLSFLIPILIFVIFPTYFACLSLSYLLLLHFQLIRVSSRYKTRNYFFVICFILRGRSMLYGLCARPPVNSYKNSKSSLTT